MRRGKKALLGEAFGATGLASAFLRLGLGSAQQLRMLTYHRVLDVADEDRFAADPELVSAGVHDFEAQMRFVRAHFTPLTFAQVLEAMDQGRPLPSRSLIVTFDDGHIDNYTNAFPVLRALGVPATIFLATDYVGSSRMFWFDRIAHLLFAAPAGELQVDAVSRHYTLADVASRRAAASDLLGRLKRVPDAKRLACIAEVEARLAAQVPAHLAPARSAVSWDEVREMADAGIEFCSHSSTHPILSRIDDAMLWQELSESRQAIERETGRDVPVLAYPIGKQGTYDERVIATARACGYRLGISYETGINLMTQMDHFSMRRFAVERYTTQAMFKAMLCLPSVFA